VNHGDARQAQRANPQRRLIARHAPQCGWGVTVRQDELPRAGHSGARDCASSWSSSAGTDRGSRFEINNSRPRVRLTRLARVAEFGGRACAEGVPGKSVNDRGRDSVRFRRFRRSTMSHRCVIAALECEQPDGGPAHRSHPELDDRKTLSSALLKSTRRSAARAAPPVVR